MIYTLSTKYISSIIFLLLSKISLHTYTYRCGDKTFPYLLPICNPLVPSPLGNNSRQLLSPGQQPTANPVIIIHQNNSTSSNVSYLNHQFENYHHNHNHFHQPIIKGLNPSLAVTTRSGKLTPNSMESCSSFSTSSSNCSSSASMNNVEATATRDR